MRDEFEYKKYYEKGTKCWWWSVDSDGKKSVILNINGYMAGISKHTIDKEGNVNPSVLVETSENGKRKEIYHAFITLKDYEVV